MGKFNWGRRTTRKNIWNWDGKTTKLARLVCIMFPAHEILVELHKNKSEEQAQINLLDTCNFLIFTISSHDFSNKSVHDNHIQREKLLPPSTFCLSILSRRVVSSSRVSTGWLESRRKISLFRHVEKFIKHIGMGESGKLCERKTGEENFAVVKNVEIQNRWDSWKSCSVGAKRMRLQKIFEKKSLNKEIT